ncbi:alpha/beta hydrolase fold [Streptoalloteichus tenebrarius]|uniref:Alpha/beta hydrolase fold n=1 Tax=Streptoalloteichus tenebrarius (strain ATCC 17920 / DSM 40477 / JCM 4838 / CBS 697.72 / NBRC 16177 / NCIMB 11028 / NRRL B-12390 / A12253. 1 / ISP 5477) TaxID=1933 RepID=A0ABT1HYG1_STRSD|nr:alpha/beta fold hydrolase [Streptoalloteichus tenebrarius]MCP2260520.1 alpha/beta hydrolase fold [Streptoalloteichus tenebrarius]BFF01860.1 alpha/beta hydrolase [Streptoalloteichus tenebrarius]
MAFEGQHRVEPIPARARRTPSPRWRAATVTALALAASAVMVTPAAAHTTGAGEEPLRWERCANTDERNPVRCARVAAPVDWSVPRAGDTVDLLVARLPATSPERRVGTLFFNPGGPGGASGTMITNPAVASAYFPEELRERFDIVGVDPRGVGGSRFLRCDSPVNDPEPTRFPGDVPGAVRLAAANARFGVSCLRGTGPLAAHLDTGSVARDMDLVRARLGEERISFLGISYGTMLAQSYAELFPRRVRALVLDGVVDRSLGWRQMTEDGAAATEEGFAQFVAWCERTETCAVRGRDPRALMRAVLDRADRAPIPADGRTANAEEIASAVSGWLGDPSALPLLARGLREAADSNDATTLVRGSLATTGPWYAAYRAIICQDVPVPPHAVAELPSAAERARRLGPTLRGASEFWGVASGCVGWPVPSRWQPHGWRVPTDFPPALLLAGAHDVSTPAHWAENVHRRIPNSRLLRWDGFGHSAWGVADPEAARAMAAGVRHLVDPTTPAAR